MGGNRLVPLLAFLLLFSTAAARAGSYDRYSRKPEPFRIDGTTHIGFRGGLGSSSFTGDDVGTDTDPDKYRNAGVFLTYWLTPTVALETELYYAESRGVQTVFDYAIDPTVPGGSVSYYDDILWKLSHVEIPVLFRWSSSDKARNPDGTPRASVFDPYYEVGLAVSYNIAESHSDHIRASAPSASVKPTIDYLNWGAASLSLMVGSGANLRVGPGFITMQARFRAGVANLGGHADKAQSTVIALLFGYGWRIR